ncbi:hypothetical protein DAPPPG734_21715 (plasmid) [Pantoea agglomerans]|uniref:Uncharacterized protein n=1 Tax=Enterobacter agglomerans TaxID=549 RepID=A0AAN2FGI4_ENTAG|nr:hypothetical protein DAPPPG734_21715 [Pantoea agglomerans]
MSVGIIKKKQELPFTGRLPVLPVAARSHCWRGRGRANVHQAMKYKAFNCGYAFSE